MADERQPATENEPIGDFGMNRVPWVFTAVLVTGLVNHFSHDWGAAYRLNLVVHPLLGLVCAMLVVHAGARRLEKAAPGLDSVVLFGFFAILFLAFFRSYSQKYFEIQTANGLAGITFFLLLVIGYYSLRRLVRVAPEIAGRKELWFELAVTMLWNLAFATGVILLVLGGGRELFAFFSFHGFVGLLTAAATLVLMIHPAIPLVGARRALASLVIVPAGLLLAAVALDAAWDRLSPKPGSETVTIHLSTIPLEQRARKDVDDTPFPIEERWLNISSGCGGSADCHPRILEDFRKSTHNLSYRSPHLQKNLQLLADEIGDHNRVLCDGCHIPGAFFSGGGQAEDFANRDNYSCVFCHSISEVRIDDRRRSSYTITLDTDHIEMFLGSEEEGAELSEVSRRLINLNPRAHGKVFSRPLYGEDRYCMACHHLQLPSGGSAEPRCVVCHMEPRDQLGLDGKVKNHFFPGANVALHKILGMEAEALLIENWMQSRFLVAKLEDLYVNPRLAGRQEGDERLRDFLYLTMESELTRPAGPGGEAELAIVTRNIGVPHNFPSSALDLYQAWLEVEVSGPDGRLWYASGGTDATGEFHPGTVTMAGYMIGKDGAVVEHNRVWQIAAKVSGRQIEPGGEVRDVFSFRLPDDAAGFMTVRARWRYRKYNPAYWRWAYGDDIPLPAPVVVDLFRQYEVAVP